MTDEWDEWDTHDNIPVKHYESPNDEHVAGGWGWKCRCNTGSWGWDTENDARRDAYEHWVDTHEPMDEEEE